MNILRIAWSSYENEQSLLKEERALKDQEFNYLRVQPNGPLPSKLQAYDALLINSQFEVSKSFIDQWTDGLILTTSNGYDHIDLRACRQEDVSVARTPRARSRAVVDHTFGFIDALLRDHHRTGHQTRNGDWPRARAHENIRSESDCILGIIGYGVIGRKILERARGRNFEEVLVHDPLVEDPPGDVSFVSRDNLVTSSDIVSLHADLNPSTQNMVDSYFLDRLSDHSYLINTARGRMVDLSALSQALCSDRLAGAALDVYPEEPPQEEQLDTIPGLLTTPHSAGFHSDLLEDLREEVVSVLTNYREDESIKNLVTHRSEEERRRLEAQPNAN